MLTQRRQLIYAVGTGRLLVSTVFSISKWSLSNVHPMVPAFLLLTEKLNVLISNTRNLPLIPTFVKHCMVTKKPCNSWATSSWLWNSLLDLNVLVLPLPAVAIWRVPKSWSTFSHNPHPGLRIENVNTIVFPYLLDGITWDWSLAYIFSQGSNIVNILVCSTLQLLGYYSIKTATEHS